MLRNILLAALLLSAVPAYADYEGAVTPGSAATRSALVGCVNNTVLATLTNGQQVALQCDGSGRLFVTTSGSSGGSLVITGPVGNNADGVVPTATGQVPGDSYNYVWNSVTGNWDRMRAAATAASGNVAVAIEGNSGLVSTLGNNSDANAAGNTVLQVYSNNLGFNGNSFDRLRTLGTTSPGILGVGISPNPSAIGGIVPVASVTAGNVSLIIKAAPGNLYSVTADNSSATAGKLIVVDSATVPATGTLANSTVKDCVTLPASGSASINYAPGPMAVYSNGIVALLSSGANCTAYTTGTVLGFMKGAAQ